MELVCTVLICQIITQAYGLVQQHQQMVLWAPTPRQNHEGMETDDLSANDNDFMHYMFL
jgi:hypothetical protein